MVLGRETREEEPDVPAVTKKRIPFLSRVERYEEKVMRSIGRLTHVMNSFPLLRLVPASFWVLHFLVAGTNLGNGWPRRSIALFLMAP